LIELKGIRIDDFAIDAQREFQGHGALSGRRGTHEVEGFPLHEEWFTRESREGTRKTYEMPTGKGGGWRPASALIRVLRGQKKAACRNNRQTAFSNEWPAGLGSYVVSFLF
jgi:hypothetical protein